MEKKFVQVKILSTTDDFLNVVETLLTHECGKLLNSMSITAEEQDLQNRIKTIKETMQESIEILASLEELIKEFNENKNTT